MKRYMALIGAGIFGVACCYLYLMMESVGGGIGNRMDQINPDVLAQIEGRIQKIQNKIEYNQDTVHKIKKALAHLSRGDQNKIQQFIKGMEEHLDPDLDKIESDNKYYVGEGSEIAVPVDTRVQYSGGVCREADSPVLKTDIQMLSIYDLLPFNNQDGGVWKQGFPITYSAGQWTAENPLKVFIVPHSHTDPGWIKTFEGYYVMQLKNILNNMLPKLEADPKRKFMYAEMSFFSRWWKEISQSDRSRVKKLVQNGQFEIVTGGWVMTDEANAHYYAMIDQLIEGQHWLYNQLGIIPEYGWAIDPFGHSSTMAYILKRTGFKGMLIQRVHYEVKKHLARSKQLEFMWRQNWDHGSSTDMFCHMMPFYSYDVPHTCGPDPKVCCQYDFKRLPGGRLNCPWKVPPVPITGVNIAAKAEILLDQYRKKSQLYRNNMVLIPLGDDFRYDKPIEWDQQFDNYKKLMDYMNSRTDWNVQAQFGTLGDYFKALYERMSTQPGHAPPGYPTLSGDFFTYTDRKDNYWSGYYTSRPFYKSMDRVLESTLRAAEIAFSLSVAHARQHNVKTLPMESMKKMIVASRRDLGLFQHHDGITGTAKDFVVKDYADKMLAAINSLQDVMRKCADFLLTADKTVYNFKEHVFNVDETRASQDSIPEKSTIKLTIGSPRPVVFYNSLSRERDELIRIYVDTPNVLVKSPQGQSVTSQVDLVWINNEGSSQDRYRVVFLVKVPALGMSTYTLQKISEKSNNNHPYSTTTLYNGKSSGPSERGGFKLYNKPSADFNIQNSVLRAGFSGETGFLKEIKFLERGTTILSNIEFVHYGTVSSKDKSGAYLFMPDGQAKLIDEKKPFIRVIEGDLLSEVRVFTNHVEHVVSLCRSPGPDGQGLHIYNTVNIIPERNYELAMRLRTNVQNGDEFFTDLNGFQVLRRKTYSKLPLQANFYPMPTMAYIEDHTTRLTFLSGQSLGVAALKPGWLEIMMDRRLNQDDNRGLQQGVLDNKRTPNTFVLLVEHRNGTAKVPPTQSAGYPSALGHAISQQTIHPIYAFPSNDVGLRKEFLPVFTPLARDLPCELYLLNLRTLQNQEETQLEFVPKEDIGIIFHRLGFDCSFPARSMHCHTNEGKVSLQGLFKNLTLKKIQSSSLNLLRDKDVLIDSEIQIPAMEIQAFKIRV